MSQNYKIITSEAEMRRWAAQIGARLRGGECIELVGDVGAGKTTFVKGLARGLDITDDIQSPSFTVSRVYEARDGLLLDHYDFYRLPDAGVLEHEFAESVADSKVITVVEWADIVHDILPKERLRLIIKPTAEDEDERRVTLRGDEIFVKELLAV